MAIQNKMFTDNRSYDTTPTRKTYQREELLSKKIAEDLNTYKNFGIFHSRSDVVVPAFDKDGNQIEPGYKGAARSGAIGVRSIFNAYSTALAGEDNQSGHNSEQVSIFGGSPITTQEGMNNAWNKLVRRMSDFRHSNNVPLVDSPTTRRLLRQHNDISVKGLVEASKHGALSRTPYSYADFMYCKYLNRVPNNYLITLRRFANPVMDNIRPVGRGRKKAGYNRSGIAHPIGTMVTWLGVSGNDMGNILKYSYSMAFEEKTAGWQQITKEGGEGILNSLEAGLNPSTRKLWQQGFANNPLDTFVPGLMHNSGAGGPYQYPGGYGPHNQEPYKTYGPIDRVKKNYMRGNDGLSWDMKFSITFDYELRAYNGINPRQAMLDLIASILSTTYTTGGFWPGGYYGGGMGQSSTFRNLSIFKATGGFTNYMDALVHDISTIGAKAQAQVQQNGGWLETVKKVLNMIGGLLMGALINKLGRPAKYYAPSLLSEAPCGFWHITIGNPYRPIISMGNMILLKTEIKHSGPLGLDDFPTNLTVTCEFDRGKPRDQYGIEAIYMNGNDRIYQGMSDKILDMYKAADVYKKGKDRNFEISFDKPGDKNWEEEIERRKKEAAEKEAALKKQQEEEAKKAQESQNTTTSALDQTTSTTNNTTNNTTNDTTNANNTDESKTQKKTKKNNKRGSTKKNTKKGDTKKSSTGQGGAANAGTDTDSNKKDDKPANTNKPGNDGSNSDANKDNTTAAGSNPAASQSAGEIDVPGMSIEDTLKAAQDNIKAANEFNTKFKNLSVLREVFGDPDASVIIWSSKEQQEGSANKMVQESAAKANTNGEGSGDGGDGKKV